MKRFDVVVHPAGAALLLGGQTDPAFGGHKATARDREGKLVVPASALRGALRIELERLLRGRGVAPVCSANRPAATPDEPPCPCPICRIFGEPGTTTGTLRLGDGVFEASAGHAAEDSAVRPQVAVSRTTGSAVEDHLVFYETSPVYHGPAPPSFRAHGELLPRIADVDDSALDGDLENLAAACRATRAIGAGKARGLGWVCCALEVQETTPRGPAPDPGPVTAALRLVFTAEEPLHFAAGRPEGYYHATRRSAPASTVRGAIAFALLEQRLASAKDPGFEQLFVGPRPARFGTAWPMAGGSALHPSATLRRCRGPAAHEFDDLVSSLLVRRAAKLGLGLAETSLCPEPGCPAKKADAAPAPKLHLRTRTRVALNRGTGTAMDAKLYSQEALEPPLMLAAEVHGLGAVARERLLALAGGTVRLGGKRSKGFGRCRLAIESLEPPALATARAAVAELAAALEAGWRAIAKAAPVELDAAFESPFLPAGRLPLAIELTEPWHPPGLAVEQALPELLVEGPLGPGTERAAGKTELLAAFVRFEELGRFPSVEGQRNQAPEAAGETQLIEAAAPGSVYVYTVAASDLESHLEAWLGQGAEGLGPFGWGRFVVRGPGQNG